MNPYVIKSIRRFYGGKKIVTILTARARMLRLAAAEPTA